MCNVCVCVCVRGCLGVCVCARASGCYRPCIACSCLCLSTARAIMRTDDVRGLNKIILSRKIYNMAMLSVGVVGN